MPRKPTKNPRLVDRDYDILDHLARYRLTTRDVLHRLFFDDSEINAVTKVTSRLTDHGFLNKYEWAPNRNYFVIGRESARIMGVSPKKCKPLGSQTLPKELATLMFCCMGDERRERLKVSELQKQYPDLLARKIDNSHYYVDRAEDGAVRLAFIRVDQGGTCDHIARRCEKDLEDRANMPSFRQLVDSDRFMIAIITASDDKAERVRETIRRRTWPVRFRVAVVKELAQLIARSIDG